MREEEKVHGRTASETDAWYRNFVWFFLGGAVFLLLDAAVEMAIASDYATYMFVGGALALAGSFWGESRRQRRAEGEYDGHG